MSSSNGSSADEILTRTLDTLDELRRQLERAIEQKNEPAIATLQAEIIAVATKIDEIAGTAQSSDAGDPSSLD